MAGVDRNSKEAKYEGLLKEECAKYVSLMPGQSKQPTAKEGARQEEKWRTNPWTG